MATVGVGRTQPSREDPVSGSARSDRLNPASFVPLYVQLTEILQERIESGRWAAGERFPSEAELSSEFGVSRAVIRPALTILENNGQIVRIKGKGTFVSAPKSMEKVMGLVRDVTDPGADGRIVRVTDVNLEPADGELAEIMQLGKGERRVLHAACVVEADGRLIGFRDSFITPGRAPGIAAALENVQRFGSLRRKTPFRIALRPSEVTVETSFATPFEADIFEVSAGVPTLLVKCLERARVDGEVVPVEFARMVYRADVVMLQTSPR